MRGDVKMKQEELDAKREYIRKNIMTTSEVLGYLGFSRQRLNQIVHSGRLTPIIEGVFLKDDIILFKKDRPAPKIKITYKKRTDIQEARKAKGLTQKDVAEALGVSISYYGKIERGESEPPAQLLNKIQKIVFEKSHKN